MGTMYEKRSLIIEEGSDSERHGGVKSTIYARCLGID